MITQRELDEMVIKSALRTLEITRSYEERFTEARKKAMIQAVLQEMNNANISSPSRR